jgi:hypothetical protein
MPVKTALINPLEEAGDEAVAGKALRGLVLRVVQMLGHLVAVQRYHNLR